MLCVRLLNRCDITIDRILPFRRLSSGENRGPISQSLPRRSKVGLGTLLHCLAVLGPYVSADPSNKTLSTTLKCYIIFLVKDRFQYIVTFKDNIFMFRKNSRRKYFSFRDCNRGSKGGPACQFLDQRKQVLFQQMHNQVWC